MQEFRALIEKCRIVLIALQDEMPALAQPETAAEVFCDPANQK